MTTLLRRAFSSFPASSRIAPRFCVSISLPGSHRFVLWNECQSSTRLRALVPAAFPSGFFSPSFRLVFVFLCSPQIRLKLFPISGSLALCVCTHGLVSWHGMRFPCLSSAVVFSPTFPVAYFPFLSSGFLHLSSTVSPLAQVPSSIIPGLLAVSGSTTPSSGFGSVARGVCRSAHHTTLPERHLWSERQRSINISLNEVLWTGNMGCRMLISTAA